MVHVARWRLLVPPQMGVGVGEKPVDTDAGGGVGKVGAACHTARSSRQCLRRRWKAIRGQARRRRARRPALITYGSPATSGDLAVGG